MQSLLRIEQRANRDSQKSLSGSKLERIEGLQPILRIWTLEGVMEAQVGDWIIQGVKGEIYPCKPDIFKATYEPVG